MSLLQSRSCSCSCGFTDEDRAALVGKEVPGRGVHGSFELVSELLAGWGERRGGAVTEGTEGPAQNVVAEVEQLLDVAPLSATSFHPLEDLHQPPGAPPARRALTV